MKDSYLVSRVALHRVSSSASLRPCLDVNYVLHPNCSQLIGCRGNPDWAQSVPPSAEVVAMPFAGMFFPTWGETEFTHSRREFPLVVRETDIISLFPMVFTSIWQSSSTRASRARGRCDM